MAHDPLERLDTFIARIDPDCPRLIVRWADELRLQSEGVSGYTVAPIAYVILTASVDGQPHQERIEGLAVDDVKQRLRDQPIQVLYRSDNIT